MLQKGETCFDGPACQMRRYQPLPDKMLSRPSSIDNVGPIVPVLTSSVQKTNSQKLWKNTLHVTDGMGAVADLCSSLALLG